jgi:putative FmdB family regulatory protein
MPIYEYRCENGHRFEVMQRMTEDPLVSCTTCAAPVQRVFHPVAVHFKGSGFYTTDYRDKRRSGEGERAAAEGAGKGKDKAAESKGSGGDGDGKSSATDGDG